MKSQPGVPKNSTLIRRALKHLGQLSLEVSRIGDALQFNEDDGRRELAAIDENVREYDTLYTNLRITVSVFVAGLGTGLGALLLEKERVRWGVFALLGPELFLILSIFISSYFQKLSFCCSRVEVDARKPLVVPLAPISNFRQHFSWLLHAPEISYLRLWPDLIQNVLVSFSLIYVVLWTWLIAQRKPSCSKEWLWFVILAAGTLGSWFVDRHAIKAAKSRFRHYFLFSASLLFFAWCVVLAIYAFPRIPTPAPANVIRPEIGPFASGFSCEGNPEVQRQIEMATMKLQELLQSTEVVEIEVTGSTDAQPLIGTAKQIYRNDVGLALARARCVGEEISRQLHGLGVEMPYVRYSVRAPQTHGLDNPEDRMTQIRVEFKH